MKKLFFLLIIILISFQGKSQVNLLDRPELLEKIKLELYYTYGMEFDKSRKILKELEVAIPNHPVLSFLDALNIYWENFPLTPENPLSEKFIDLMEANSAAAKKMLEKDPESLEGLFFDLFGRAFYSEFWADNGKPSKVLPYLAGMYRQTMKGRELKDKFNEFYFTTGLYNYYIEAYPEKHPAYKPIKILFQSGNKAEGLRQLEYCADNSIYVKNEARAFLSLIYLFYESNPSKASEYAASLYRDFPKNPLYASRYAEILIYDKKYAIAEIIVQNLARLNEPFAQMNYHLYNAMILEKYNKNYDKAFAEYTKALEMAEQFGEIGSSANAIAWMGLGRYYQKKNNTSEANHCFKTAQNYSTYDYVLDDK
ncbi:MAG: tetratricopeptide repeat protein [Bacteroidales bacterium]|nr:tetratricopeptide repeat protein [Bacteroidales bacterium]MCB8999912.1 tetratricopeptide repeat protein [Bacteroidales bacterium]